MVKRVVRVVGQVPCGVVALARVELECGHTLPVAWTRADVGALVRCGACAASAALANAVASEADDSDGLDFSVDALQNR